MRVELLRGIMSIRNTFEKIISFENLLYAEKDSAEDKRYDKEVLSFRRDFEDNIVALHERLEKLDMPPAHYKTFLVYIPKVRKVIYIDYTSKIVQRAIYNVINPLICKKFIEDTYACIEGRGQLAAMLRLKGWFENTRHSNEKWYYYKFDVAKFFYRIDHEVMMSILSKKIDDKYTVEMIRYYVCSTSRPFGMPIDANHLTITEDEMLWDVGIPIGGGLSHMLGNMYLDPLDQYAKRVLRIKKYIRYMDDIIIMDTDKNRLREWAKAMSQFIQDKLRLQFNNKSALRPVSCGCEFVGYVIFPDHTILRKQTTLRIKRRLRQIAEDYRDYKINFDQARQTVASYKALLKYADSKRFEEKLWEEFVLTHNKE